jgi:hypothetical protein
VAGRLPANLPPLPPIILQPKQAQMVRMCEATGLDVPTVLGYGGARGGAKSGFIRRAAIWLLWQHPQTTAYIIQRTSKDLYDGHICKLQIEFPSLAQYWSAQHNEYKFQDGRRLAFRYADTEADVIQLSRGPEPTWEFIDQAEQFTEREIRAMRTGVRNPAAAPGLAKQVLTFNPGGVGTAYLRRIFHTREYQDNERAGDYEFLKAVGWDNYEWFKPLGVQPEAFCSMSDDDRFQLFITSTSYGQNLWALPESERLGQLYGSFDRFEGQYYADVWEEKSLVISPEKVRAMMRPWWKRWLSTDWGFSHYACTLWWTSGLLSPSEAREYLGVEIRGTLRVVLIYRQLVCNDTTEPDLARAVVAMTPEDERREMRYHWIGHDAFDKRGSSNTIAEQMDPVFLAGGLPRLNRADIDRMGGWRLLYNAFRSTRKLRAAEGWYTDVTEEPPCLLISAECPEVVSAFPMLICNPKNPQDVKKMDGQVSDDVADCARYGLKTYLGVADKPLEVERQEVFERHQDPQERAMTMLAWDAENERGNYISRTPRG